MKKMSKLLNRMLLILGGILLVIFLGGLIGGNEKPKEDEALKANVPLFMTIAEKHLSKLYGIADPQVETKDLRVVKLPTTDELAETGKKLENMTSGYGKFEFENKLYNFDLLYDMEDGSDKYTIIYLRSDYDETKEINLKLKSDE